MKNILIPLILFLLTSCTTSRPFNKKQWAEQSDPSLYPNRNSLVDDLILNHKLIGLSYHQLTEMIGEADKNINEGKNEVCYSILTEYGHDIDPVHTKTLVFKLSEDSIVTNYEIEEWVK
jgi:hypothetical protein